MILTKSPGSSMTSPESPDSSASWLLASFQVLRLGLKARLEINSTLRSNQKLDSKALIRGGSCFYPVEPKLPCFNLKLLVEP
jgi:hypothetical protein